MFRTILRWSLIATLSFGAGCEESDDDTDTNPTPADGSAPQADAGQEPPSPVPDAGASAEGGSDASTTPPADAPLLPWKEGNTWTYKVTGGGEQTTKVTTVHALEPVGGTGPNATKMAFKVVTKKGELDQTISWQAVEGESVVRYREQSFGAMSGMLELEEHWVPSKLRISWKAEHLVPGASWIDASQETKIPVGGTPVTSETRDVWKVDGVDQTVTVPAGTFTAIVLIKSGGTSQKTYWYVPGVGKVKETGGQTEELVSFQVSP